MGFAAVLHRAPGHGPQGSNWLKQKEGNYCPMVDCLQWMATGRIISQALVECPVAVTEGRWTFEIDRGEDAFTPDLIRKGQRGFLRPPV